MAAAAAAMNRDQAIATLKRMKVEQNRIVQKIVELEAEMNEHRMVSEVLKKVEPGRRCYRLVGGVLVERTAGEVLPAIEGNREKITGAIAELQKQLAERGKQATEFMNKHQVMLEKDDEAPAGQPAAPAKSSAGECTAPVNPLAYDLLNLPGASVSRQMLKHAEEPERLRITSKSHPRYADRLRRLGVLSPKAPRVAGLESPGGAQSPRGGQIRVLVTLEAVRSLIDKIPALQSDANLTANMAMLDEVLPRQISW
eukprot:m51a1_g4808 putative prefoldin subunit 2 (255) ;mRNA; f:129538-131080